MELKDLWKFILALFGIGSVAYLATGAFPIPQSSPLYAQVLQPFGFQYNGASYPCVWEIQPAVNNTVNLVQYGAPGNWTGCTQNSTDWLLWNCGSVTTALGNVSCPQIHVLQNTYPSGTNDTTLDVQNASFSEVYNFTGDTTLSTGTLSGNYTYTNLVIDGPVTIGGNTTGTSRSTSTTCRPGKRVRERR